MPLQDVPEGITPGEHVPFAAHVPVVDRQGLPAVLAPVHASDTFCGTVVQVPEIHLKAEQVVAVQRECKMKIAP